ncbi:orotate phosphoribosyltransferase [Methylocella silvestris]|uniref:Orotate phosphoribosyltransferase n=1 Tax=Methylocella silvestris TaxID=199596 RepID=A0A2J7TK30_METSI|nr:orotate phosphoribosyltransferase [Methylocella silvestris]PNG27125.1 orotate phosphoribosyltransferase [Methylocella silvestris]
MTKPTLEKQAIARETAKMLIEVEAILFNPQKPFIFTSGWASPVYTDMRKLISFPRLRSRLMDFAVTTIEREIGYERLDIIAGGETAGIPYAAWLSERLMLPMQYVRKKPKGFGRNARIEGVLQDGARTLLVEDLASDGRSKVSFCEALREAGQKCDHVFVFFFYGIFPEATQVMADLGVSLHHLVTWRDILAVARAENYFEKATLDEVEAFLNEPAKWSAAHGGIAAFKS